MKKLLLLLLILSFDAPIFAMKRKGPESPAAEVQEEKALRPFYSFQEMAKLEKLPRDAQILILLQVINNAPHARQAARELRRMASVNKAFYRLINNGDVNQQLIQLLAQRFTHGNAIEAAEILGTNAAIAWSSEALPEAIRRHVKRILNADVDIDPDDVPDVIANRIDDIIENIIRYMKSNQRINAALHTEFGMIWLLRTILKQLNTTHFLAFDEYMTATELAERLYPEGIYSQVLQRWITYADRQINVLDRIYDAFEETNIAELQRLGSEGIDIFDPMINRFIGRHIIKGNLLLLDFVLNMGINVNEQSDDIGDTVLHIIFEDLIQGHQGVPIPGGIPQMIPVFIDRQEQQKRLNLLRRLLQRGANPGIRNNIGQTPAMVAEAELKKIRSGDPVYRDASATGKAEIAQYLNQAIQLLRTPQAQEQQ